MADGKNIEIKIAATGGDQAAAEILKVEDATKAASTGFGGMLDGVPERTEEAKKSLEELKGAAAKAKSESAGLAESFQEVADGAEEATKKGTDLEDSVRRIKEVQIAAEFAKGADKLAAFAVKLSESGEALDGAFGAENAAKIREISAVTAELASTAGNVAQAFAAGGPWAAVATATAAGLTSLYAAQAEAQSAMDSSTESTNRAVELYNQLNAVLEIGADRYFGAAEASARLKEITDESTTSINAEREALENRNKILDADTGAYRAKRDREDATAIRNGAVPENVKIQRVQDDEAAALRKLDREDEARRAGIKTALNAAAAAEGQVGVSKVAADSTPEKVADAEVAAKLLADRVANMVREAELAERINRAKRTEIKEESAGKVEGLVDQRTKRQDQEALKQQQEAAKTQREAEAAKQRQNRDREGANKRDAKAGQDAVKLLPDGGTDKFRAAVNKVAAGLQNGDQGGEIKELLKLMEELAAAATQGNRGLSAEMQKVRSQVAILQGQIKNTRGK